MIDANRRLGDHKAPDAWEEHGAGKGVNAMTDNIVAPRQRDLDELACQLASWLATKLPQTRDLSIANLAYPSGAGMSHETILFDAVWREDGEPVSQAMVVRVKPVANQVFCDDLFEEQVRIMQVMHAGNYVPVAEVLWLERDSVVIGAPFFVMRQMHGRVPVSRPPYAEQGWIFEATPDERHRLWQNSVTVLAAIPKVPLDQVAFLAGPDGAERGLEQEWDKYSRFVEWVSRDRRIPVLDAARDALRERWPANRPQGLVWGGAEMVNMMFDEDFNVVCVMDWEQPSLGGPLNDLAWWLYMADMKHGPASGRPPLAGMGTRAETIALWEDLTGLSAQDIEWYEDFMALKIACLSISTSRMWGVEPPDQSQLAQRLNLAVT